MDSLENWARLFGVAFHGRLESLEQFDPTEHGLPEELIQALLEARHDPFLTDRLDQPFNWGIVRDIASALHRSAASIDARRRTWGAGAAGGRGTRRRGSCGSAHQRTTC